MLNSVKGLRRSIVLVVIFSAIILIVKGVYAQGISPERYIEMIAEEVLKKASKEQLEREVAYNPVEWISRMKRPHYPLYFVRIEKEGLPIFVSTALSASHLKIIGLGKKGECLYHCESVQKIAIGNPLSNLPPVGGTWYKVMLLNGEKGWVPAQLGGEDVATLWQVNDPTLEAIASFFTSSIPDFFTKTIPNHPGETALIIIFFFFLCRLYISKAREWDRKRRIIEQEREEAERQAAEEERIREKVRQDMERERIEKWRRERWKAWKAEARTWSRERIKAEIVDLRMQINELELEYELESQRAVIYNLEAGQFPHYSSTFEEKQKIEFLKSLL